MAKSIKYYKSINEIPVYIFYKIIQEKNYKFLVKKYEDKQQEISEKLNQKLKLIFTEILNRYNAVNADSKTIKSMKAKSKISIMELEYKIISEALKNYSKTEAIEFLFLLNDVGGIFSFNSNIKVEPQIEKALKSLKSLKMKIKIAKISYSKLYKLEVDEEDKTDYISELEKRAINIERVLELKYQIDTKKTSLLRWCNLIKLMQEKLENHG